MTLGVSLEECCNLFQIPDINKIDEKELKKKYHKLCLKYHPDKYKDHKNKFLEIKECYDTLNEYIEKQKEQKYNTFNYNPTFKNNNYSNSQNIYEIIIAALSIENIEYALKLINSYKIYMNNVPEIITLNVSLKQVFERSVYVKDNEHYIPLWHNMVHKFSVKEQKHIIYIIKINDIPDNIKIMKNNDIVVNILKSDIKKEHVNNIKILNFVKIDVYIGVKEIENSKLIIKNKGIPKTNINDIFDISKISDIHLQLK
tara:strand:- start:283 stop:1053 length:771 start_codon:yes stop_codon:yes gene_type:complete